MAKRVAICMRGAVAKTYGAFFCDGDLYKHGEYVDYKKCYASILKHIIAPNSAYTFDFFCQGWNLDLEDDLTQLYHPVRKLFEDNTHYSEDIKMRCVHESDFRGISQALSMKKSIELKEHYETDTNTTYDIVILYRYDVLLWKDMILDTYTDRDAIYVNAHSDSNGDFHFVMNSATSNEFKYLYDSVRLGNPHNMHYWIKNYVLQYMKTQLLMDDIYPGAHQEVLRKIGDCIHGGTMTQERLDNEFNLPYCEYPPEYN